eukprot:CCRYP_009310-RA/>CCRYP_009310-RA protein AED:0.41 eAED:0.41 QI:0/0/0/1/0/0/2/0/83
MVGLFLRPNEIEWFCDFAYKQMTLSIREQCNGCPQNRGVALDDEWFGKGQMMRICSHLDSNCGYYLKMILGSGPSISRESKAY